ncbi:MAG TPA: aspartate--tRNA ligase, partial [Gemmatimonadales bacterium]|nr:aspartate--tRNA ligase [Gemmatimonadales bacterium]
MTLDHLPLDLRRTHGCGELRPSHAGARAVVMGWVSRRRDLGSLIFIDLRDRSGVLQVVFNRETVPREHARAEELRSEFVIAVEGSVVQRDPQTFNRTLATGEVELAVQRLYILNDARTPPFPVEDDVATAEETRLRYRFLDLRRPRMQANIQLRHQIVLEVRRFMSERGFLEIETPFLTRSTPEGARDYLVPSRVQPGSFYALPQSPQLFKQLLMISGLDKYFQIVRCFRDEDLRADRQPEFTQVDVEMSFAQPEMVFEVIEPLMQRVCAVAGIETPLPFPRLTYDEAIRRYGTDKPDLRLPPLEGVRHLFTAEDRKALGMDPDLPFVAVRLPGCGGISRKERDELRQFISERGLKCFDDLRHLEKNFPSQVGEARKLTGAAADDLVLLVAAPAERRAQLRDAAVYAAAGELRMLAGQKYAERHGLLRAGDYRFLWVTDFPMFEYDEQEKRFVAMHHPFTSPQEGSLDQLETDPGAVKAKAYDLVLNGSEIGGGSIRIHRQDIQRRVFAAIGFSEQQA